VRAGSRRSEMGEYCRALGEEGTAYLIFDLRDNASDWNGVTETL
jgi:hypothetical protein